MCNYKYTDAARGIRFYYTFYFEEVHRIHVVSPDIELDLHTYNDVTSDDNKTIALEVSFYLDLDVKTFLRAIDSTFS